jgi:hypothetical protein
LASRLFCTGILLAALELGSNGGLLLFELTNEILCPDLYPVCNSGTLGNDSSGLIPINAQWQMWLNAHSRCTHRKRARGPEWNRCVKRATRIHTLSLLDESVAIEECPNCLRREISLDSPPDEPLAILNELIATAGFHVSRQSKSERERPSIEDNMKAARPVISLSKNRNFFRVARNRRIAVRA